jgi:putative transposase
MPRSPRIHLAGGFYHVTLRGNHQQPLFHARRDRTLLNIIVARALAKFGARLHAYCWMTNHLHLLIQVGDEVLGRPMRQIAAEYARAAQIKLETTGHFFERRYHARLVDTDSYLLEVIRYIHLNPVEARVTVDPDAYSWSSHHNYRGRRTDPWVTTDFALKMFAATRARAVEAYERFIAQPRDSYLPATRKIEEAGDILGDDDFVARARRAAGRSNAGVELAALIEEACRRFEVDVVRLKSPRRDVYVSQVRAWISHQAKKRHVATLSEVARALGRDEATLRYAMSKYPDDAE